MSETMRFEPKYVLNIAEKMANNILKALDANTEDIHALAPPGTEKTMVERLHQHIASNTKQFQNRLFTPRK